MMYVFLCVRACMCACVHACMCVCLVTHRRTRLKDNEGISYWNDKQHGKIK